MSTEFKPPILSYDKISEIAESFLNEWHPQNTLPVPIENIVENAFQIDIVPFPNLQRTFEVEGFTSADMSCIYVDEFIFSHRYNRYIFTLAHEIGHVVLHKDILSNIRPKSVGEWAEIIEEIDEVSYGWLEYQAYSFAGLVLVPRRRLIEHANNEIKSLHEKIQEAKTARLSKEQYSDYVIDAIATSLAEEYAVSTNVLVRRISKEIESDNIIVP